MGKWSILLDGHLQQGCKNLDPTWVSNTHHVLPCHAQYDLKEMNMGHHGWMMVVKKYEILNKQHTKWVEQMDWTDKQGTTTKHNTNRDDIFLSIISLGLSLIQIHDQRAMIPNLNSSSSSTHSSSLNFNSYRHKQLWKEGGRIENIWTFKKMVYNIFKSTDTNGQTLQEVHGTHKPNCTHLTVTKWVKSIFHTICSTKYDHFHFIRLFILNLILSCNWNW